jgi:hypothetical protein
MTFYDYLAYIHKKNLLHEFLGKIIINTYTKTHMEERQLWRSEIDVLRYTVQHMLYNFHHKYNNEIYLICDIIQEFTDKVLEMIIKNIKNCNLQHKENMQEYFPEYDMKENMYGYSSYYDDQENLSEYLSESQNFTTLCKRKILSEITIGSLCQKIFIYVIENLNITPYFQIGTNFLEID